MRRVGSCTWLKIFNLTNVVENIDVIPELCDTALKIASATQMRLFIVLFKWQKCVKPTKDYIYIYTHTSLFNRIWMLVPLNLQRTLFYSSLINTSLCVHFILYWNTSEKKTHCLFLGHFSSYSVVNKSVSCRAMFLVIPYQVSLVNITF